MNRLGAGAAVAGFAVGAVVGAYSWARYTENRFALKSLSYVRDDSTRQIEHYEKLKQLIAGGDQERLVNYVDRQIEMARLSARAAEESMAK